MQKKAPQRDHANVCLLSNFYGICWCCVFQVAPSFALDMFQQYTVVYTDRQWRNYTLKVKIALPNSTILNFTQFPLCTKTTLKFGP